jgi:cupin fold WbuC family metalloprotein
VKVGPREIAFLKEKLAVAPRGRVRLCAHSNSGDLLHEMIIAMAGSTYVRPHKHQAKSESFHVIEGIVDVVVFAEGGTISEIIKLGEPASGRYFYYRLSSPVFHTLLIRAAPLVIHETTNGPFHKEDAIFAEWAPAEEDREAARAYLERLASSVETFQKAP